MYLCGHPGTGKTSTLNLILSELMDQNSKDQISSSMPVEVFLFNAMTYSDVRAFSIQFLEEAYQRLTDQEFKEKINRQKCEDEILSQ